MLVSTSELLRSAQSGGYAIGAFNVYNLEGAQAVVAAAESANSPAMLQLHPGSIGPGGRPLIALCLSACDNASVPMSVHLDHSASVESIKEALSGGLTSIMADGSEHEYAQNLRFTREMVALVHGEGGIVEAELGRLTGTEDDLTVPENLAKFTDPAQSIEFVSETGIDALAVCIGNVHGSYRSTPNLDFERLEAIRNSVSVPLVLHGASGLPEDMVKRSIELGIVKFNVNTEVRRAYLDTVKAELTSDSPPDLAALMAKAVSAMQATVADKLTLFGSTGKA